MDADGGNPVQLTSGTDVFTSPLWIGSLFHLDDDGAHRAHRLPQLRDRVD